MMQQKHSKLRYYVNDSAIWEEIYNQDEYDWIGIKDDLERFFNGESTWILQGTCECWDGNHKAGMIFEDFEEMLNKAAKDCDCIHLYDKNGHLYLKCSHHDGTNYYEIKKLQIEVLSIQQTGKIIGMTIEQNNMFIIKLWKDIQSCLILDIKYTVTQRLSGRKKKGMLQEWRNKL